MNELVFHPVLPATLLAAVLTAIALVCGWTLWTGLRARGQVATLAALRLVALAALGFVLWQPQQQREDVTILRPQLAILVDNSQSMTDPADPAQPRRADRVRQFLESPAVARARKDFDVRLFALDGTELPSDGSQITFPANGSGIVAALAHVQEHFKGQPLAAVLLLSDGLDTSGAAAKPEQVAYKTPVDTFELETPFTPPRVAQRVSIAGADFPPRVVTGWHSDIHVTLAGRGMNGQSVPVELWRDGEKVADAAVAFSDDEQTRPAAFSVTHERAGNERYEIRVPDAAADKEARAYPFSIEVLEPGQRVLYIANQLGFDFKFLRRAIVSNRNLQLASFVRWTDGKLISIDDGGPGQTPATLDLSPRALEGNAVVILGDLAPDALPVESWRALREFVDHGGGLVLIAGPASFAVPAFGRTALGPLLPVGAPAAFRQGAFAVEITDTGLHHPVFGPVFAQVKDFPPLLTCDAADSVAADTEVLMQAEVDGKARPLVAARRFGQGRVVALMTDTVWRWRLGAVAWRGDKSPYELFWAQLLDWLIPKEPSGPSADTIELFTERASYVLGEKPEVRAIVQLAAGARPPASLPLRILTPDDKTFDYTMHPATIQTRDGRSARGYAAAVEPNVAGVFRAEAHAELGGGAGKASGELRFVVTRPATEITGKPINRQLLRDVASASKGRFYPLGAWNDWPRDLHVQEQHFSRVELDDLWNRPWLLGLLMSALAAEWILRKMWHLP